MLKHMPGLTGGGRGINVAEEEAVEEVKHCRYFHIQACCPGGLADADGGFAKRLLDHAIKASTKMEPKNFIKFPSDWQKEDWAPGEIHMKGGEDYLVPFVLDTGPTRELADAVAN